MSPVLSPTLAPARPISPLPSTPPRSVPPAEKEAPKEAPKEAVPMTEEEAKKAEEKKKADERKKREREAKKAEDDYIRSRGTKLQLNKFAEKRAREEQLQESTDPATCDCQISIVSYEIKLKEKKPNHVMYKMQINYAGSEWIVFRKWGQFSALDSVFKSLDGYIPFARPPKSSNSKQAKFDPPLLAERCKILNEWMQIVIQIREAIFNARISSSVIKESPKDAFTKFLAPIQLGDQKGADYLQPFRITL